jgi:hypothetical protein
MLRRAHITRPHQTPAPRHIRPPRRGHRRRMLFGMVFLVLCGLGLWISSDPARVPQAVDLARTLLGPGPVAQVETWAFQAQDALRHAHYQATGASSGVQWAAPAAMLPPARSRAEQPADHSQHAAQPAVPTTPTLTALSASIWSRLLSTADGQPVLERASVAPDPSRPYVSVALVRIDLGSTQLHLVAGTNEPRSSIRAARPGAIPAADQRPGYLLAAFNGGFKAINGAYGMAVSGITFLPPKDGLATLALYRDGSIRLGVWGRDIVSTPDLAAYRQNCPLLLDRGQPTAETEQDKPVMWGYTVRNMVATWRSGLGLSADGRYLIYAVGDGLTVPTLARALALGGADRAMQLDINSFWTRFVIYGYASDGKGLVAQKLLAPMVGDARQFLAPDSRDFFYVTAR